MHIDSFIGGRAVAGVGGATIARVDPSDGVTVVGTVADASADHVSAAIGAARAAASEWAAVSALDRASLVRDAIGAAVDAGPHSGDLIASELGKPAHEAAGEFAFARALADYCAEHAVHVCADTTVDDAESLLVTVSEPFGVIAAITPWNAPVILAALKIVPALMTGNTLVLKPSPLAPLAVTSFVAAVAARLPAGVLNVVNGGADAGAALVGDSRVDLLTFTGGPSTARVIGAAAATLIRPTVMELGGNDAALVLDDAVFDDELYSRILVGAFLTSGQVCMAIKRVFVPAARHREFVDGLIETAARTVRVGDPHDPTTTMGPVVSGDQKARIAALVESARVAGGRVVELGSIDPTVDPGGFWMRPVLVLGLDDEHELVREEQFGPALPILTYESLDDAIARANSVEHALASSVWSTDTERATGVARRLRAGMTFINCHNRSGISLRAAFGGRGFSGHGREFGEAGMREYLQSHSINYPVAARPGHVLNASAYPVS
ncbi:aldehyde dehydrogenase family protein [Marisediminicola sp. LYQ134]|uniref:aldehyde dehydrogenase family protein n=1 Tax=unclassified Marisediminicola TaxID=2618316 RepID=UPI003982E9A8